MQDTSVLVLPATAGGEQLLENQRTVRDFVFIPTQATEVVHGTEHRGSKHGTCSET